MDQPRRVASLHSPASQKGVSRAAQTTLDPVPQQGVPDPSPKSPEHDAAGPVFLEIENLTGQIDARPQGQEAVPMACRAIESLGIRSVK